MTAFVFEGVDKAGKTTLLKKIKAETGLQLFTVRRPAENGWEALTEFQQGKKDAENIIRYARENHGKFDFLMDRFSYSELVYCKAFDRPCDFSYYEQLLKRNRDVIKMIYIWDDVNVISERWKRENLPVENVAKIMVCYEAMIIRLRLVEGQDYIRFRPQDDYTKLLEWIAENGKNSI